MSTDTIDRRAVATHVLADRHITLHNNTQPCFVSLTDDGDSHLSLWQWAGQSVTFGPAVARQFGEALIAWADRRTPTAERCRDHRDIATQDELWDHVPLEDKKGDDA